MKLIRIAVLITIVVLIIIGVFIFTFIPDDDSEDCPTVKEIEMNPFQEIPPECLQMK